MRLFVGIDIPDSIKQTLGSLVESLWPGPRQRWSPPANYHVTTKFIGEWHEERLEELKLALASIRAPRILIAVRGLGWYPNPHAPKVFWAGIRAPESLPELANRTADVVAELGVEKEQREYSPHLTLARIDDCGGLPEIRRRVAALDSVEFGEFTAAEFHLYLSRSSVYTKLRTYPLGDS